jgi:diguanylate cyclase (GGDEF)-like protein/PAS domain S-box-containing protein
MPRPGDADRRRVFDTLDEGVVVQDADGAVRDFNAAALRMLGLTPEQLRGRAPVDAHWNVSWENGTPLRSVDRPLRTVLQTALERGRLAVGVREGAATRWLAISSHLVYDDEDARETVVSTMTDVTAQREMELQNAHYREIIDTLNASYHILEESPIGMCSVDAQGTVLRGNMAFLTLGGAEQTSILALVPDDDRPVLRDAFARLIDGLTPSVRIETRIRRPTGAATWCEITAVAMRQGLPDAAILLLINDVTERRRREARLRQLAERDPLTGLHNRRSFEHVLRERLSSLEQGRRAGADWTLMLIDLDGFKEVNDTCGHARGDAVLVAVAAGIRDRTRVDDVVGRLGGDEFAVLLQSRAALDATAIGEDIIARISAAARTVEGAPPVSASIGIVHLRPGRSADVTLAAADQAMYEAKRAGKARVVDAGAILSRR